MRPPITPAAPGRTLLLHTGGAKTGSSAVQAALHAAAGRLAEAGVTYALSPGPAGATGISSGNGPPLTRALERGDEGEVRRLLGLYVGGRDAGLASSETMERLDEAAWRRLAGAAREAGIGLRVVHVARDPLPLLLSVYDQMVKRHGEARPVAEWARTHRLRMFAALRTLDRVAGRGSSDLRVLRYEDHPDDLAGGILAAFGLDPRLLGEGGLRARRINRSLDEVERSLLLRLNAAFGDRYSREVSDLLLAAHPDRPGRPPLDPALPGLVRARHGADVAWANATLFADGGGLRLPDAVPSADSAFSPPGRPGAPGPERLVLDWAIGTLVRSATAPAPAPAGRDGASPLPRTGT